MKPLIVLAASAAALTSAAAVAEHAAAAVRVVQDDQGRDIRLDVRAPIDVEGYRKLIAGIVHGDEIEDVTFRVVPERRVANACLSQEALACYAADPGVRPTIVIPARQASRVRNVLVHEYGHHIDRSYDHRSAAPDFDGTARWWSRRRVARQLAGQNVAWDYSRGWGRSIAEIFAEDYVILNVPGGPYDIFWLNRPGAKVREAMRQDIVNPIGLSRQRLGPTWINRGATRTIRFTASPSRRRLVIVTRVRNPLGKRPIRTTLRCAGGRFLRQSLAGRNRLGSIRVSGAPIGPCEVTLAAGNNAVLYETTVLHKR
jgi:hypothetical protein